MPPSTTLEQVQDATEKRATYKPPKISAGDDIVWYPDANPTRTPHVGHADEVYPTAIDCTTSEGSVGVFRDAVRHIGDPELVLNSKLKRFGAWDFPQKTKDFWAFEAGVKERLDDIEIRLTNLDGGSAPAAKKRGPGRPKKEE